MSDSDDARGDRKGDKEESEATDVARTGPTPGEPPATAARRPDAAPTAEQAEIPTLGADAAFEGGASVGPYRLVRRLGSGGMGTVWEAVHVHLHKAVAVKLLSPRLMQRPEVVARFYREMRAAGRVTHPNVVQAYDAGEFGGVHFLAMELVDGVDLHRLVVQRGPLSIVNAARALRQAAQGLSAAHAEGLVHRDVKPMNLLVSKSGKIKLLDLGLARVAEEAAHEATRSGLTAEGHVMGTPDYMAPEQWDDARTAGPAADLYSLGCTLFFLLIGRAPFETDRHSSAARKMLAHLGEPPPDLIALRPDVPPELDAIYRRLTAKRPEDRPASAAEVVALLAPFAGKSPKLSSGEKTSESETFPPVLSADSWPPEPTGGDAERTGRTSAASGRGSAIAGCLGVAVGIIFAGACCFWSLVCMGLASPPRPRGEVPDSQTTSTMLAEEKPADSPFPKEPAVSAPGEIAPAPRVVESPDRPRR